MAPFWQETSLKCLRVKRIALSWFVSGLIAWDISNLVSQGHSSLIDAHGYCWKLRVMAKIRLLDSGKCCCFKANFILPAAGTELDPAEIDSIVQILDLYRRWGCLQPLIASEARRTVGTARTAWRSGYEFGAVRSVLAHLEESLLTNVSRISGSRKHLPSGVKWWSMSGWECCWARAFWMPQRDRTCVTLDWWLNVESMIIMVMLGKPVLFYGIYLFKSFWRTQYRH